MLLLSLLLPAFGAPDAQARTDGPPPAPDTVGVIALRDVDGTLTTLRVDSRAGLTLVGPGVYVPRADGWWRLQAGRISVDPRYSFGWTAAAPLTRPVLVPAPEDPCGPPVDGMVYEAGTVADVVFVSPEWLVVEASGGMDCGGAHPTAWDDLVAGPLGESGVTEARTFADVFGADAARVYRQAGMRARAKSEDPECFEPDPSQWGVVRTSGRWALRGRFRYGPEACRGQALDFTVNVPLPPAMIGLDRLPLPFDALAVKHPGLTDAVASPDGRLVVLVFPDVVVLEESGVERARLPAESPSVVMAQWATGAQAAEWVGSGSPIGG